MDYKVIEKHTFECTKDVQELTLSRGIWFFELWGAQGGCQDDEKCLGGYSSAQIIITEPKQIFIYVGGKGEITNTATPKGGYNGGGNGYNGTSHLYDSGFGGGGGGGTDIRFLDTNITSRVIIAGGGGGQGWHNSLPRYGGDGGGETGEDGECSSLSDSGGKKGTNISGGAGGTHSYYKSNPGTFGQGGAAIGVAFCGGGGGGGYYGGGGAYETGGGGGSGYISPVLSYRTMKIGANSGDGKVIITKLKYGICSLLSCSLNYYYYYHLLFIVICKN